MKLECIGGNWTDLVVQSGRNMRKSWKDQGKNLIGNFQYPLTSYYKVTLLIFFKFPQSVYKYSSSFHWVLCSFSHFISSSDYFWRQLRPSKLKLFVTNFFVDPLLSRQWAFMAQKPWDGLTKRAIISKSIERENFPTSFLFSVLWSSGRYPSYPYVRTVETHMLSMPL